MHIVAAYAIGFARKIGKQSIALAKSASINFVLLPNYSHVILCLFLSYIFCPTLNNEDALHY